MNGLFNTAAQFAGQVAAKNAALIRKKAIHDAAVRRLQGFASGYATERYGAADALRAEALESQAALAALQSESGAAGSLEGGARAGFFTPKVLLLLGGLAAAVFLFRR